MKLKDLRIAYNVLDELGVDIPRALLIHLSKQIRQTEDMLLKRRMNRMSDEALAKLESRQKRTLRIITPDGLLFQKTKNDDTFQRFMMEVDLQRIKAMNLMCGRKPLLMFDETMKRRRIKGYNYLHDGYFLLAKSSTAQKMNWLRLIDEELQLNCEIMLV